MKKWPTGLLAAVLSVLLCTSPILAGEAEDFVPYQGDGFRMMIPADWEVYPPPHTFVEAPGENGNGMTCHRFADSRYPAQMVDALYDPSNLERDPESYTGGWFLLGLERGHTATGYEIWRLRLLSCGGKMYNGIIESYKGDDVVTADFIHLVIYLVAMEDANYLEVIFYDFTGDLSGSINRIMASLEFDPAYAA